MILLPLAGLSFAATLTVGPAQPYRSIGAAVAASGAGDTISVEPGTYVETLDLRGRSLTVIAQDGPARTTIQSAVSITLDGGALEGFRIESTAASAVLLTGGAPTLQELEIVGPPSYGVDVSAGSPVVQEVAVFNAGQRGFIVRTGTAMVLRSVSYGAPWGFQIKSTATVSNSIAIGGEYGFVFEAAGATFTNCVGVGASVAATAAISSGTLGNSAFLDNGAVVRCFGGSPTFTNGIAWNGTSAVNCTGLPLASLTSADPGFASWGASLALHELDFRPTGTSPMADAGIGTDPDGSPADLGAFGGSGGTWRDRDADGFPVLFDCDDHDAATYPYAGEIADGLDNDCDDVIDEDIPVDTGDTGDDTGDTHDTDDTDDTDDTGVIPSERDLDRDGYTAEVDCGEHNIATHPGAVELMDSTDNDCDGLIDENTANADNDGDSFSVFGGDCDDTDPGRYPGAYDDRGYDGIDNDCDGHDDLGQGADNDADGYLDDVDDCDDTEPGVHPGAPDPTDGVDQDCDGLADDDALRADGDGDGITPEGGDCNDANAAIFRGNVDAPDDFIDQDCTGEDNYDVDRDGDAAPASGGTDCDDGNSTVNPAHDEICDDNADNDCDGVYDEGCVAVDGKPDDGGGCGCAAGAPVTAGWVAGWVAGAGLLVVRRRRGALASQIS